MTSFLFCCLSIWKHRILICLQGFYTFLCSSSGFNKIYSASPIRPVAVASENEMYIPSVICVIASGIWLSESKTCFRSAYVYLMPAEMAIHLHLLDVGPAGWLGLQMSPRLRPEVDLRRRKPRREKSMNQSIFKPSLQAWNSIPTEKQVMTLNFFCDILLAMEMVGGELNVLSYTCVNSLARSGPLSYRNYLAYRGGVGISKTEQKQSEISP